MSTSNEKNTPVIPDLVGDQGLHCTVIEDVNDNKYILENPHALMPRLIDCMHLILYTKESLWEEKTSRDGRKRKYPSSLAKHLAMVHVYAGMYVSGYTHHPFVRAFFEVYPHHPISSCRGINLMASGPAGEAYRQKLSDFIDWFRNVERAAALKKQAKDWESKTKKNLERSLKLARRLFQNHARLAVIRLDLHLKAERFSPEEVTPFLSAQGVKAFRDTLALSNGDEIQKCEPLEGRVSFETIAAYRQEFFNRRHKNPLFEHLVGYIWRIEFAPGAGYHVHLLLFFDGSQVQKHKWLADEIGKWWQYEITQGCGFYHNVNADWDESDPSCGIGMIDHFDLAKHKNLEERVLPYLSKPSQMVYVLPYPGANTFGSSTMPPPPSGLGRPRKKDPSYGQNQRGERNKSKARSSLSFKNKDLGRSGFPAPGAGIDGDDSVRGAA